MGSLWRRIRAWWWRKKHPKRVEYRTSPAHDFGPGHRAKPAKKKRRKAVQASRRQNTTGKRRRARHGRG